MRPRSPWQEVIERLRSLGDRAYSGVTDSADRWVRRCGKPFSSCLRSARRLVVKPACSAAGVKSWVPTLDLWRWTTTGDLSVTSVPISNVRTQLNACGRCPPRRSRTDHRMPRGGPAAISQQRPAGRRLPRQPAASATHRLPAPTLAWAPAHDHRRAPHLRGRILAFVEEQPSVSFLQTPAWASVRPSGTASRWAGSTTVTSWERPWSVPAGAEGQTLPGLHPGSVHRGTRCHRSGGVAATAARPRKTEGAFALKMGRPWPPAGGAPKR